MATELNMVSPINRRLSAGLAVSLLLHALLIISIGSRDRQTARLPAPFEVEIIRQVPQDTGSIAGLVHNENIAPDSTILNVPADTATQALSADPASQPLAPSPAPQSDVVAPSRAPVQLDIPLDKYYSAREVDIRAEQVNEVDLVYPKRAYENRTKGRVLLRI